MRRKYYYCEQWMSLSQPNSENLSTIATCTLSCFVIDCESQCGILIGSSVWLIPLLLSVLSTSNSLHKLGYPLLLTLSSKLKINSKPKSVLFLKYYILQYTITALLDWSYFLRIHKCTYNMRVYINNVQHIKNENINGATFSV